VLMEEEHARAHGFTPLARFVAYTTAGVEPERFGIGPVPAIRKVLQRSGLTLDAMDLVELNEAFAAQVLAVLECAKSEKFARKVLGRPAALGEIPLEKLNVNGGAIALGHPVGATGARLVLTSLKELKRRNQKRALVSVCVGGGQGAAIWLEAL